MVNASRAEDPGFKSHLRRDFFRSSHTSDLKTGTPVATLPGAWRYRVRAGTGWPSVSILRLGEMESLICNFYLSVAAHRFVCADVAWMLSKQRTNKQTPPCQMPGIVVSARRLVVPVSILWLGLIASWICNFNLSVTAHEIVWVDRSLRYK